MHIVLEPQLVSRLLSLLHHLLPIDPCSSYDASRRRALSESAKTVPILKELATTLRATNSSSWIPITAASSARWVCAMATTPVATTYATCTALLTACDHFSSLCVTWETRTQCSCARGNAGQTEWTPTGWWYWRAAEASGTRRNVCIPIWRAGPAALWVTRECSSASGTPRNWSSIAWREWEARTSLSTAAFERPKRTAISARRQVGAARWWPCRSPTSRFVSTDFAEISSRRWHAFGWGNQIRLSCGSQIDYSPPNATPARIRTHS